MSISDSLIVGGCECDAFRFALNEPPLFTHACHCLDCQRRSGSAFGMTTIVLRKNLSITTGEVIERIVSPRTTAYLCSSCGTRIYSGSTRFPTTYNMEGGTFDDPAVVSPGAHLWLKRKHPWIEIPRDVAQFDEGYDIYGTWPRKSLDRLSEANNAASE